MSHSRKNNNHNNAPKIIDDDGDSDGNDDDDDWKRCESPGVGSARTSSTTSTTTTAASAIGSITSSEEKKDEGELIAASSSEKLLIRSPSLLLSAAENGGTTTTTAAAAATIITPTAGSPICSNPATVAYNVGISRRRHRQMRSSNNEEEQQRSHQHQKSSKTPVRRRWRSSVTAKARRWWNRTQRKIFNTTTSNHQEEEKKKKLGFLLFLIGCVLLCHWKVVMAPRMIRRQRHYQQQQRRAAQANSNKHHQQQQGGLPPKPVVYPRQKQQRKQHQSSLDSISLTFLSPPTRIVFRQSANVDMNANDNADPFSKHLLHGIYDEPHPDYGGLEFSSLKLMQHHKSRDWYRNIIERSDNWYEHQRHAFLDEIDEDLDPDFDHYDELDWSHKSQTCHKMQWSDTVHPTCNHFHEFTLERELEDPLQMYRRKYLAHGAFRDTWSLEYLTSTHGDNDDNNKVVLKSLRGLTAEHVDYSWHTASFIHKEAIVMERTSSSDATMDVYGHCFSSMLVEYGHEISQRISHGVEYEGRGRISQNELDAFQKDDVLPFNDFIPEEKLDIALMMAEGIAVMHGHEEGVIVNDDVHPDQWLVNKDGLVKFNDFNNCKILEWDAAKEEYCKFEMWIGGDYRSPEELSAHLIDEKSDVWPLGANVYALLTGLFPYYATWDRFEIEDLISSGVKPELDPRYKTNRSFIERRLVEIMERCFEVDPVDRVSIFEVVEHMCETKRMYMEQNEGRWPVYPQNIVRQPANRVRPSLPGTPPWLHHEEEESESSDEEEVGHYEDGSRNHPEDERVSEWTGASGAGDRHDDKEVEHENSEYHDYRHEYQRHEQQVEEEEQRLHEQHHAEEAIAAVDEEEQPGESNDRHGHDERSSGEEQKEADEERDGNIGYMNDEELL